MIYLDYLLDKILSFIVCVFYGTICAWSVYFNLILLSSCCGISWKKRLLSILAILILGIEFGIDFEWMFWKSDEICDFWRYKGILNGIISHLKITSPFCSIWIGNCGISHRNMAIFKNTKHWFSCGRNVQHYDKHRLKCTLMIDAPIILNNYSVFAFAMHKLYFIGSSCGMKVDAF